MDPNVPQVKWASFYGGQMGVPGSDTPLGIRHGGGGNVYYVGLASATHYEAADVNDGTSPLAPKATIQSALDACVADNGDVVVVFPGTYEQTVPITLTVDGVRLFAWDYTRGPAAPSVFITSATDDFSLMTVNADAVEIAGLNFDNGSAVAAFDCISLATTGAVSGCFIHHNKFTNGGGYGVNIGSALGVASDTFVQDNTFVQIDDNAGAAGVRIGYAVRADVQHNWFWSDQAGTYGVSIRNAAMGGSIVRENDFVILEAGGVAIFRAGALADVAMHYNRISGGPTNVSAITQQVDGGIYAVWNYTSGVAGGAIVDATT
jgi:hypothetical protein